ncbi:MAG: SDR family oxidoreductase [Actinomycetales bacterium]|nr:SDR family oxidoreductase [Actinomycetales bacterium]
MTSWQDTTIVVTGAAQGIGRATVDHLVACGATVAAWDLDASVMDVFAGNPRVLASICDITKDADVTAATAAAVAHFCPPGSARGPGGSAGIGGLVNNAGIGAYYDPVAMSEAEWDHVMSVDLKGAWMCVRRVLPELRRNGGGAIVNISSIHGRMTIAGMFPYAAAKAGVEGMTRSLALDLAAEGIRVNALAPGYVRTRLVEEYIDRSDDPAGTRETIHASIPLHRMAEPIEIATTVEFLLSDRAGAITGAVIAVDCGLSVRFAS